MAARARRYVIVLWLIVLGTFPVSLAGFILVPQAFYFRPWEYFSDIVYLDPLPLRGSRLWEGCEKGDLSANYFLLFQECRLTRVSTDADGFRTSAPLPGSVQLAVLGDSFSWGTGLSDDETFAWRLARRLDRPVFNAGRDWSAFSGILANPKLADVHVVLHVLEYGHVVPATFAADFDPDAPFLPYQRVPSRLTEVIPLQRYYLPAILMRQFGKLAADVRQVVSWGLYGYRHPLRSPRFWEARTATDWQATYEGVQRRSRQMRDAGYAYLLVAVPSVSYLAADAVEPATERYFTSLFEALQADGVEVVDMLAPFRAYPDPLALYWMMDGHWSEQGTALAATVVAERLRETGLVGGEMGRR